MTAELKAEEVAAVTMLLQAGKTIRDIAKFAELDAMAITRVARKLDLEPSTEAQRQGKLLFASPDGLTYQQIAKALGRRGFTADDDAPMHHLTVASWVRNFGWPWGGASDGEYAPERAASAPARPRYVLRLSRSLDEQINADSAVVQAAEAAWVELATDKTRIVQLAIIRGAATVGVTDLAAIKKVLLDRRGLDIRSAKADEKES